jgi:hypothetical protein
VSATVTGNVVTLTALTVGTGGDTITISTNNDTDIQVNGASQLILDAIRRRESAGGGDGYCVHQLVHRNASRFGRSGTVRTRDRYPDGGVRI